MIAGYKSMQQTVKGDLRFLGDIVPSEKFLVEMTDDVPVVVNLECPVTRAQVPAPDKVVLKAEIDWLINAFGSGLRVACLANNHIMDFGAEGFSDTVALLELAGVKWFGAGMNIDAARNGLVLRAGNRFMGFCGYVCPSTHPIFATANTPGVLPLDLDMIREDLHGLRDKGAHRVVVCLHWGAEEVPYPSPRDIELARTLADMGADLIIGHHSHCIQPYEIHNGRPIFYGIGNAVMPDLDLPSHYNDARQPERRYVKKQRSWNRRSLMVDYTLESGQVMVGKLNYDKGKLICGQKKVAASQLLYGSMTRQAAIFRWAGFYGQLRNLVFSFVERPRWPRLCHLRSLVMSKAST